jgi:hypothetical protein
MKYLLIMLAFISINISQAKSQVPVKLPNQLVLKYSLINTAEYHVYKKEYTQALSELNKIASTRPYYPIYLAKLKCYIGLNRKDEIEQIIKKIIVDFGVYHNHILNDLKLAKFSLTCPPISINEDSCYLLFLFRNLNHRRDLFDVEHLFFNDLLFRNQLSAINGKSFKENFVLAKQYDSAIVTPFILSLIKKHNFPDSYDIGEYSTSLLYFMLRHNDVAKTILDSALICDKIPPIEYAQLTDYLHNYKYNPEGAIIGFHQNFGTLYSTTPDNTWYIQPPDDIEHVDERRTAIGLPPLWQTALINGYKLPQEYIDWLKKNNIPFD